MAWTALALLGPLTGAGAAPRASAGAAATSAIVPVYRAGEEGYKSFRIPAIIRLPDGELLAFAEGRVTGAADFGNVRIVMKRSRDEGKTWSALQVVARNGSLQAGNSAPVVDRLDPAYPDARVFLFYNTGDKPEADIRKGIGTRRVWYETSRDSGHTWSAPVEITRQVKKAGWRAYANTPGHALQLTHGAYAGRIYIAANHSRGKPLPHFRDYHAHGYYSDDHGKTFHLGQSIPFAGSNEASAAELAGDGVMMNMRNQTGTPRARIVATSNDGGARWNHVYVDRQLPDPVSEGSLLTLGYANGKAILAFCNDADTRHRTNLTLRISTDGGKTWQHAFRVDKPGVGTAYSDIVKLGRHAVGVLYERKDYSQIAFRVIRWQP